MGGESSQERQQREAQEAARRREAEAAARQERLLTIAETPDPLTERLRAARLNWLDFTEGKQGPIDISKAPGFGPELDIYNRAKARREGERMGIGVLKLGEANPQHAALLKEQRDTEREQEAAGALENAFRVKDAEMKGSIMPLINMKQGKDLGLAELASGNFSSANDAYLRLLLRQKQPGFFSQLAGGLAQGAGSAAIAGLGI